MPSDRPADDIERIEGVQYVITYGPNLRVVFSHNADSGTIREVEEVTGCSGKLGATQEHLPCIEYPKRSVGTGVDQEDSGAE